MQGVGILNLEDTGHQNSPLGQGNPLECSGLRS